MDASEPGLSRCLAAGDPEAFATLYARHGKTLYGYLVAATGCREAAEDLLQTVWLRLVRYRRRLRGVEDLRAYLFRVARNESSRRERAHPVPLAPESLPDLASPLPSGGKDGDAVLRRAVARLSRERREVVALKAWHGLTFSEIGALLDLSPNTAASRYRLALADLRSMLREALDVSR